MTRLLQVRDPKSLRGGPFVTPKLIETSLHDGTQFGSTGGKLDARDALQRFRLGQESLILTVEIAGEHVKLVRFVEGFHKRCGLLFGLLNQRTGFSCSHHGRACVHVNRNRLLRSSYCIFWHLHGVGKGQNQGREGQHPKGQDQKVAQSVARLGLFLNVSEKGDVGKRNALESPQLQEVQGDGDGECDQPPKYVRPSPHVANLARF